MVWLVNDAEAHFSEFLDATLKDGPQVVTKQGVETAVLISMDEWKRLKAQARPPVEAEAPRDPRNAALRLKQMAELGNGWLDGKGIAPGKEGLGWLADQFDAHFDEYLPLPYLYPTAEGGVQAEWSLNGMEVSLEIDLDTRQGDYQALNLRDGACTEFSVSLAGRDGWKQLNDALRRLANRKVEASASGT